MQVVFPTVGLFMAGYFLGSGRAKKCYMCNSKFRPVICNGCSSETAESLAFISCRAHVRTLLDETDDINTTGTLELLKTRIQETEARVKATRATGSPDHIGFKETV